jgi:hypothetical protein
MSGIIKKADYFGGVQEGEVSFGFGREVFSEFGNFFLGAD